ncbi:MAG: 50S ribosomal protein L18 [Candidatus Micrarchaeia archaeon]
MFRSIKYRRRKGVTNYKKRIELLKGNKIRAVVRKSNRGIIVQFVDFEKSGDKVLSTTTSSMLKSFKWLPKRNTPTAYLTGLLAAKRFSNNKDVILDIGLYKPIKSSIIFAAAKGIIDGGVKLAANIEFDEKRINGTHIVNYANLLKDNANEYKKKFSKYTEMNFDASKINELFEIAKSEILNNSNNKNIKK